MSRARWFESLLVPVGVVVFFGSLLGLGGAGAIVAAATTFGSGAVLSVAAARGGFPVALLLPAVALLLPLFFLRRVEHKTLAVIGYGALQQAYLVALKIAVPLALPWSWVLAPAAAVLGFGLLALTCLALFVVLWGDGAGFGT